MKRHLISCWHVLIHFSFSFSIAYYFIVIFPNTLPFYPNTPPQEMGSYLPPCPCTPIPHSPVLYCTSYSSSHCSLITRLAPFIARRVQSASWLFVITTPTWTWNIPPPCFRMSNVKHGIFMKWHGTVTICQKVYWLTTMLPAIRKLYLKITVKSDILT